jgi:transcriptional regulator with XRE-family HTH domain
MSTPNGNLFFERLRSLRGHRSKAEYARELGIPAPVYQRYETGRMPATKNLSVIARHGNVTVDWLLGRDTQGVELANIDASNSSKSIESHTGEASRVITGILLKHADIDILQELIEVCEKMGDVKLTSVISRELLKRAKKK